MSMIRQVIGAVLITALGATPLWASPASPVDGEQRWSASRVQALGHLGRIDWMPMECIESRTLQIKTSLDPCAQRALWEHWPTTTLLRTETDATEQCQSEPIEDLFETTKQEKALQTLVRDHPGAALPWIGQSHPWMLRDLAPKRCASPELLMAQSKSLAQSGLWIQAIHQVERCKTMSPHLRNLIRARILVDADLLEAALHSLGLAAVPTPTSSTARACDQPWKPSQLGQLRTPSHVALDRLQVLRTPMAWKILAEIAIRTEDAALAATITEHLLGALERDPNVWSLRIEAALMRTDRDEHEALLDRLITLRERGAWVQAFRWTLISSLADAGAVRDAFSRLDGPDQDLLKSDEGQERYARIILDHGDKARLDAVMSHFATMPKSLKDRMNYRQGKKRSPSDTSSKPLVPEATLRAARVALGKGTLLVEEAIEFQIEYKHGVERSHRWVFTQTEDSAGSAAPTVSVWTDPLREELQLRSFQLQCSGASLGGGVKEQFTDLAEPELRLYYGLRRHDFLFPEISPGCVAQLVVRVRPSQGIDLGRNFGREIVLDRGWPTHSFHVTIHSSADRPIYHRIVPAALRPSASQKIKESTQLLPTGSETVERRLTFTDLPTLSRAVNLPGDSDLIPTLVLSTHEDVFSLGSWYQKWAFGEDHELPDSLLQKIFTGTSKSRRDRLVQAHRFAAQELKYVGLEFGVHGFHPYPLATILRRGFGDCKDKSLVLHALLDDQEIENYPVLVRGRERGRLIAGDVSQRSQKQVVPLEAFNHAIIAARLSEREPWIFLDPSAPDLVAGVIPWEIQGADALILNPAAPQWTQLPISKAEDNTASSQFVIYPDRLEVVIRFTGVLAGPQRSTNDWANWLRSWLSGPFESQLVQNAALEHETIDQGDSLTVRATLRFVNGSSPKLVRPVQLLHARCENFPDPARGLHGSIHTGRMYRTDITLQGGSWANKRSVRRPPQAVPGIIGFSWSNTPNQTRATFRLEAGSDHNLLIQPDSIESVESICQLMQSQESRALPIEWSNQR